LIRHTHPRNEKDCEDQPSTLHQVSSAERRSLRSVQVQRRQTLWPDETRLLHLSFQLPVVLQSKVEFFELLSDQ
jgi:hypothetical protein